MNQPRNFLLIDDNAQVRRLIAESLIRTFSAALVQESAMAENAIAAIGGKRLDAIVLRSVGDMPAAVLIRLLRAVNPDIPIVAISDLQRSQELLSAGATRVLANEDWRNAGLLISEIVGATPDAPPSPPPR